MQPGSWRTILRSPRSATWQLYPVPVFSPLPLPPQCAGLTVLSEDRVRIQVPKNQGLKTKIPPIFKSNCLKRFFLPLPALSASCTLKCCPETGSRILAKLALRAVSSCSSLEETVPIQYISMSAQRSAPCYSPFFYCRLSKNPRETWRTDTGWKGCLSVYYITTSWSFLLTT